MNKKELTPYQIEKKKKRKQYVAAFFSRKIAYVAVAIVIFFIICAILAPFIAPHDPNEQNLRNSLLDPCKEYPLGTDQYGRDVLSRMIYGTRVSLLVGVLSTLIGAFIGMALGMIAGYFGGVVDDVLMRIMETIRAIPMVILASCLILVLDAGIGSLVFILTICGIPGFARLMRAQTLQIKASDYILSRKVTGCSDFRTMVKHIFPNAFSPLIVSMTQSVGGSILAEAGLSFLGIGIKPPTPTWGGMINNGREFLFTNPVFGLAPGVCIILLCVSLNILGDQLRDALDPRLRGTM